LTEPQNQCHPERRTLVGAVRYDGTGDPEVRVFCPACDTRHPATANFCMNCGIPLRESAALLRGDARADEAPRERRWEYHDLDLPLNFTSKGLSDEQVVERYLELVTNHLSHVARSGWEPDEAADFETVWTDGRIKWRAIGSADPTCAFDSVSIRLKRPLP
jgi:hypothetical protein